MANPVGRYVQIAVDTPENIQSFNLVKEIDTSQLTLPSGNNTFVPETITQGPVQNCKIIHGRLQSPTITQNQAILDSMGFARKQKEQYTIVTEGSTYNCPITRDEFCGALNRHFEPVEMGEKPIDWDENKGWKYWEKIQEQTFTDCPYYRIAREPWSATTQYYSNTQDFHYYYIIDGDKKVRVGIGDTGLTNYAGRMGMQVAHKEAGDGNYSGFNDAFWTFINGETEQIIKDGNTSNEYYAANISTTQSVPVRELFAHGSDANMARYLFAKRYNTGWRSKVTDEQKGQWRTRVHNEVRIKNVTTTQFGFLNHEGHRYFGIWVCYPKAQFYVGYKQYTGQTGDTNPISDKTDLYDLRSYNFDNPIPDTEKVEWDNVWFYGVELDALDVTLEEKEGIMPPDVNPNPPGGANWPGLDKDKFPLRGRSQGLLTGLSRGFKIYRMSNFSITGTNTPDNDFGAFSALVWNWASFQQAFVNKLDSGIPLITDISMIWEAYKDAASQSRIDPINAIAFANVYPMFMVNANEKWEAKSVSEINLGGYKITAQDLGLETLHTSQMLAEVYDWATTIDCTALNTGQGYLELAPYSKAEIYLPYIGFVELDPQDFFGGSIEVVYNCSIFDGAISAQVNCTPGLAPDNPVFYGPFIGSACQPIPLTQKDANAFNRTMGVLTAGAQAAGGVLKSLTSTMGNFMTGGINSPHSVLNQGWSNVETMGAGTTKAAGTLIDTMLMPQRLNHGGPLCTGSGFVTNNGHIFLIVNTPVPKYLNKDEVSKYGNASGEIMAVRNAAEAGKTVYCKFKYIDTHNIEATAAEIEAINRYLTGGVYL